MKKYSIATTTTERACRGKACGRKKVHENSYNTHVRKIIVINVGASIGKRNGKLISWTNEKMIRYCFTNLLLILIIIVCIFITRVLQKNVILMIIVDLNESEISTIK